MFGLLCNLLVSTKEMVHQIYKEAVPKTNKTHLLWDLTIYENDMQALRLLAEGVHSPNGVPSSLQRLFLSGIFRSSYLESTKCRASIPDLAKSKANAISRDSNFMSIHVKGRPWSSVHMASSGLANHLSSDQMTKLIKAYKSIGIQEFYLTPIVKFYTRINYWVWGNAQTETTYQHIKVAVSDIMECIVDTSDIGHEFAQVIGIMVHEEMVFFVLTWFASTSRTHPSLKLMEYEETALFGYTTFHPISVIDHPWFINHMHFIQLEDHIWLNKWVFRMVWIKR